MDDEIKKIKMAMASNNAVIFVGTGISTYTTDNEQEASFCKGLLKNGLEKCHRAGRITDNAIEHFNKKFQSNEVTFDDYLDAADQIMSCFKKESDATKIDVYKTWLIETVGKLSPTKPELIKAIGELECSILTTNYDSLLEDILNKKPLTWHKYFTDDINGSFENMKNYILHIHGYYEEPDSVIFNKDHYNRIPQSEFAESKLKTLMETKTLLFIGYGAEIFDPHFSNLLKWKCSLTGHNLLPIHKFVKSNKKKLSYQDSDVSFLENIKTIQ
ncbi:unnamed protein product [Didymodactylos carnosus]|uniref:Protein FAM118B n=1 Tax=Didymodactylos carnosus TaxID=1234261 RepID=A0A816CQV6_9BILA|nr:unnamed protein product [Didymodactylos carnosus]CAF1626554.1 unnamed protein product [Didymodactylos carnosus]CAF4342939.1 unnamed protein product [Didymodactylos carnosus]CAF4520880.1 unnamed protein product [Didymodactylos carnosus]